MNNTHDNLSLSDTAGFTNDVRSQWKILAVLMAAALAWHLVLWQSWPLYNARGASVRATMSLYVDAFETPHPIQYWNAAFRGPIPPLFHGLALKSGSALPDHIGLTFLAVIAVAVVYLIVLPWGRWAAVMASLVYLADLPLQQLYHQISSEGFASLFTLMSLLAFRYGLQSPRLVNWLIIGLTIGLSALSRPVTLGFLIVGLGLITCQIPHWRKLWLSAVAVGVALLVFSPWVIYRGLRYDMWTVARGSNYNIFFEAYDDLLIHPDNGPASQELAAFLSEHLLSQPAYQAANVTILRLFHVDGNPGYAEDVYSANEYMGDIVYTVDKYAGWDTNYKLLVDAAYEAIRARPTEFVEALLNGFRITLFEYDVLEPATPRPIGLPNIPGERVWPPIYSVSYSHPNTFPDPPLEQSKANRDMFIRLLSPLANVQGDAVLGSSIINVWSAVWPPLIILYALAGIAIVANRGKSLAFLAIVNGSVVFLTVYSSLFGNLPRYRMPVEGIVVFSAAIGAAVVARFVFDFVSRRVLKTQRQS